MAYSIHILYGTCSVNGAVLKYSKQLHIHLASRRGTWGETNVWVLYCCQRVVLCSGAVHWLKPADLRGHRWGKTKPNNSASSLWLLVRFVPLLLFTPCDFLKCTLLQSSAGVSAPIATVISRESHRFLLHRQSDWGATYKFAQWRVTITDASCPLVGQCTWEPFSDCGIFIISLCEFHVRLNQRLSMRRPQFTRKNNQQWKFSSISIGGVERPLFGSPWNIFARMPHIPDIPLEWILCEYKRYLNVIENSQIVLVFSYNLVLHSTLFPWLVRWMSDHMSCHHRNKKTISRCKDLLESQ